MSQNWTAATGWFSEQDAANYAPLLMRCKNELVVEVGSYAGRSAVFAAPILQGQNCKLLCVDVWDFEQMQPQYYEPLGGSKIWREFQQNTAPFEGTIIPCRMNSQQAASLLKALNCRIGLVFIDACHEYDSVKADILAWLPIVRDGGTLCGHDYFNFPGVKRAVDEIFGPGATPVGTIWNITKPA